MEYLDRRIACKLQTFLKCCSRSATHIFCPNIPKSRACSNDESICDLAGLEVSTTRRLSCRKMAPRGHEG
ncbi:hypothetical protein CEXT_304941 [Caerostris extrusa]|uniref:Uncharacterized protein n=1 Tax=Caerostris extrusa TaxID=172846 RepID=A0AAV4R125_CAEEX|nr:hypothetical protein CEXT_304941 [Caerostris extrusa]